MKRESKIMNETFYLFIFNDNSIYEMNNAVSFKDAVLEMAKNTSVEIGGYMMLDNPEDDEIQMWFSVFKLKIGDTLVYDTPCPKLQYVLS